MYCTPEAPGGGEEVAGVLQVAGPGLRGGRVLAERRVQVVGDLVEVALGLLHLLHVLPQEDGERLHDGLVGLVQQDALVLCHLRSRGVVEG